MLALLFIIFIILSPFVGGVVYAAFFILVSTYIIYLDNQKIRINNLDNFFTSAEISVMEKYRFFFRFRFISPLFSSMYSSFALATFVIAPYLFYTGNLPLGFASIVFYFVSKHLMVNLNPQFCLHDNLDNNRIPVDNKFYFQAVYEMTAIDSALEKLNQRKIFGKKEI